MCFLRNFGLPCLESFGEFPLLLQGGVGLIVAYEPGKPITVERVIVGGPADVQLSGQARKYQVIPILQIQIDFHGCADKRRRRAPIC